jgi:energy-converting hydrogenase Eha subunit G
VLIESKYFAWAAVAGFLLALLVTHGSLMAGFSAFALIAGAGWAIHKITQRVSGTKHYE